MSATYLEGLVQGLARDPAQTVSEWADAHRILSRIDSAEPGRWRTPRTPYLREVMDALSPTNPAKRVVFMAGTQLGKTQTGNNWLGHTIHRSPAPMLMVLPTVDVAKRISKQRIAPMIAATPELSARVTDSRSRDSGNTVQMKEFEGGLLIITGANSSAGLSSMPVARLFCDEVDQYPDDVDGQGDPVALAEKRTETFSRAKIYLVGAPTIRGLSRIEREFKLTDQRRYFVPCPHCGHMDWIRWEQMRWEERDPDSIRLSCAACSTLIEERHKTEMLARGEWRATSTDGMPGRVGFHLSALYSPLGWKSWSKCASEFRAAKHEPSLLKVWVNTVLAETWEERGEAIEKDALKARMERYAGEVPKGVGVLVCSVDVQGDRLEALVMGYGEAEEAWIIAFSQLMGSPSESRVWHDLDAFLAQEFTHESGQRLRIETTVVDSGGHHTEEVYRYCAARENRRVFAVKGGSVTGLPLVGRPTKKNRYRVKLFILCTDAGKEQVVSRLHIPFAGPRYVHIPEWVDDEFLDQLTAERAVRKYVKGRGAIREWVKMRERNEALDLSVYALAAFYMCGPKLLASLADRAARFAVVQEGGAPPPASAGSPPPMTHRIRRRPRPGGWMGGGFRG